LQTNSCNQKQWQAAVRIVYCRCDVGRLLRVVGRQVGARSPSVTRRRTLWIRHSTTTLACWRSPSSDRGTLPTLTTGTSPTHLPTATTSSSQSAAVGLSTTSSFDTQRHQGSPTASFVSVSKLFSCILDSLSIIRRDRTYHVHWSIFSSFFVNFFLFWFH